MDLPLGLASRVHLSCDQIGSRASLPQMSSSSLKRVERDRLRERERQARAQRAQQMATQERDVAPLFGAIVKVNPSSNDKVSQQIQSQLGPYDYVRPLLEDSKRTMVLLGSDGIPPSPAPGGGGGTSSTTTSSSTTSSGSSRSSSNSIEFKRPPVSASSGHSQHRSSSSSTHASHHSSAQSRNGFAKPADSKSSSQYSSSNSRGGGFYPGGNKAVHSTGSGASRDVPNGSGKAPYFPRPTSSSSSTTHPGRKITRPTLNFRDLDHHDDTPVMNTPSHADVDNILKEMAEFRVIKPHENLAATPRVDQDSTFSYLFEKVVCPPPKPISPPPPTPAPMHMDSPPSSTPPKNQRISSPPQLIGSSSSSSILLNGSVSGLGGSSSNSSCSSGSSHLQQLHSHTHAQQPKNSLAATSLTLTSPVTSSAQRSRHLPTQPPLPLLEKDLSLSESDDEQKTSEPVPDKSPSVLSQGSTPLSPLPENPIVSPIREPMSPPPAPPAGGGNTSSDEDGDDSASETETETDSSSAPTPTATPRQPSPPPILPASCAAQPAAVAAEAAEPPRNGWSLKNFFPSTSPHPDKKSSPDDGRSKNKTEDDSENDSEVVCIGTGKKQPPLAAISVSDSDAAGSQQEKEQPPKRRRSKRRHRQPSTALSRGHVTTDSDDCSTERAPARRPPIYTPPLPMEMDDSDSDKVPARSTNNAIHSSFDDDDDDNYRFSIGSRRPPRTPPSPPPPSRSQVKSQSPVKADNKQRGSKRGPKAHATAGKVPDKSTTHKSGTTRRNSKVEKEEMRVKKKRGRPTKVKPPRTPSESEEEVSPKVKLKTKSPVETHRSKAQAHLSSGSDDEWGSKVRSPRKRRMPNKAPPESRSSDRSTPRDSWEDKRPCRVGRSRAVATATSSEDDDDDYGSSRSGPTSSSPVKPVTRVTPAIAVKRPPRDVSPYSSDSKKEESPPKLDTEANNKKKRDTLMRLFSRNTAEGGGKGGGKGGKGGKGGGKCGGKGGSKTPGVNCEVDGDVSGGERTPFRGGTASGTEEPPRVPPISPHHHSSPSPSPRLTPNVLAPPPPPPPPKPSPSRRPPSIMCRLNLSSLGGVSALERLIDAKKCSSEEVRTRTELADTRQDADNATTSSTSTTSSSKKDRRPQDVKLKASAAAAAASATAAASCSSTSSSRADKRRRSPVPVAAVAPLPNKQHKAPYDVMRLMAPVTPQPKPELDVTTTSVPKRERRGSSSSDSSPDRRKKPMKRRRGESRHNRGGDLSNVSQTNHERETQQLAPPPPHQYGFSYFAQQNDICDQDNKCNYLNQAKRLKHSADNETDEFSQGLKYLEAVLYFLLTGKTLERDLAPESQRASYHMYKETQQIVRYISSKFVPIKSQLLNFNSQTDLHIKLAILSLRCQSLLYLKLYTMKQQEAKDAQRTIGEYLKANPPPPLEHFLGGAAGGQGTPSQPMSPTPSPAGSVGSVGSQSSGYSSGAGGGNQGGGGGHHNGGGGGGGQMAVSSQSVAALPVTVHAAIGDFYQNYMCLSSAFDLWDQANALITKGNHLDFFTDLDKSCGTLMLETNIHQLVLYVKEGIKRLKTQRL